MTYARHARRRSTTANVARLAVLAVCTLAGVARAGTIPAECRQFVWHPADDREDVVRWNQLLSLAACMERPVIGEVTDRDQLESMLDAYVTQLDVPVLIYLTALDEGPRVVQVRATYQLAMVCVNMMVRARGAVPARFEALHAELETLLEPVAVSAQRAFALIERQAARDPKLAEDPVTRYMVTSARQMARLLEPPHAESVRSAAIP